MGISTLYVGQLSPIWTIQLIPDTSYVNVSGLVVGNFSLRIRNLETNIETTGAGTFSNITAAVVTNGVVISPASVQYQPVTADVKLGRYQLWVDVTFSNGVEPFIIPELWEVVTE